MARSLADHARHLNLRARARLGRKTDRFGRGGKLPSLILLTDDERLGDPRAAVARLPRGAAVVLRHYRSTGTERAALARALRAVTRRRGILLLIAASGDGAGELARAVGADGLHLSEHLIRHGVRTRLRRRKPHWLITAAAHSLPALRRAARCGVDAALLSPVFATASHPGARPLGILRFAAWARASSVPVYALGGIGAQAAARLRPTRACGIAGIGGLVHRPPGPGLG